MIRLYLVLISLAFMITLTPLNTDPASDYAPVWSPDGSHIAFLRAEVKNGPTEIRLLTLAGMQQTKLPSAAGASAPLWSPNGSRIAYVENGAQTHTIHVMNPDGSQDQPIVERSGSIGAPAWSPDGRKIAATSSGELFVVTLENGEVDRLVDERVTGVPPLWSHDGNRLLYVEQVNASGATAIVRVDTDGDNAQTLIERSAITAISESPNGSRIAFVYREGGQQELAVMQADGSGFTRLTPGKRVEAYSAWSPDGATLAYVHNDDIYLIAPDGSQETRYTDYSGREILPTWTPDGKWIAFVYDEGQGNRKALYLYSTGNEGQQYFELDSAMTAATISWSPDSTRVIVGSYQLLTSSALYTMRADGRR
jgi:Tol biopolymer transport system component